VKSLRVGIAGLGRAGAAMIPALLRHPMLEIAGAARADGRGLEQFARDFGAETFLTVDELCASPRVDAVYIATPTELHAEHAVTAARAGKHILLEKPMASTLAEARTIVHEAERCGVRLLVGHSHSYDPPIRAIREIVESGQLGPVRMINSWYFSDWFYRPRRPAELDSSSGGGVTLRQGAHQFDIIRYIGGGLVRSVRAATGSWDAARPGQGSHAAFLTLDDGVVATAVYSGYDHFPSSELTFGVTELGGVAKPDASGQARRRLAAARSEGGEAAMKAETGYPDHVEKFENGRHQSFFGLIIVSCERGDIRQSPDGLLIYRDTGKEEVSIGTEKSPRDLVVAEFYDVVANGAPPVHDGYWGMATLEVCLATLESARVTREIYLEHQVPVRRAAPTLGEEIFYDRSTP
jgi:phthalate 4,5-cis-dihydrodiol dehydrogenase